MLSFCTNFQFVDVVVVVVVVVVVAAAAKLASGPEGPSSLAVEVAVLSGWVPPHKLTLGPWQRCPVGQRRRGQHQHQEHQQQQAQGISGSLLP